MRDGSVAISPSTARFTGTLDDLSVADLIQILQLTGKGAVITVTRDGRDSKLWCNDGAIVAAESGPLRGEAAVYRILSFEHGAFVAALQPVLRERSIFAPAQHLLLEGARRKDESALLRTKLGDLQRCVRLSAPDGEPPADASAAELALLASFRDPRSLLEALEQSELGDFETLNALVRWLDTGVLQETGERRAPAPPPSEAPPAPEAPPVEASPSDQATLVPLVASTLPRSMLPVRDSGLPGWTWGALAALLLGSAGYVIGSSKAPPSTRDSAATMPQTTAVVAANTAAPSPPTSYPVIVRVQPEDAELWLDGQRVGSGQLDATLPRDGATHELRVSASGHAPAKVVFVDASPPRELRLEPLPQVAAPASSPALEQPVAPAVNEALRGRKRPAFRAPPKRDPARPAQRTRAEAPRVRIIDDEDNPIIRVLD